MRRLCTARRKDGTPCRGPAVRGADKCRMHLGKRVAQVRLEYESARQLARLNLPPVDDPLTELARVAAEVVAWKDAMGVKVSALTSLRYEAGQGEQLRSEVALWERALDRCERFLGVMARLNIDERLTAISEAQAIAVIAALDAGLDAARVTPDQRRAALAAVQDHFAA
jgi:hypothetical protein